MRGTLSPPADPPKEPQAETDTELETHSSPPAKSDGNASLDESR